MLIIVTDIILENSFYVLWCLHFSYINIVGIYGSCTSHW